jgi:hypothetical protein
MLYLFTLPAGLSGIPSQGSIDCIEKINAHLAQHFRVSWIECVNLRAGAHNQSILQRLETLHVAARSASVVKWSLSVCPGVLDAESWFRYIVRHSAF